MQRDAIAANLAAFERRAVEDPALRRAAVAILIAPSRQGLAYVLTRRAAHLRRNGGNYALPGGRLEPGEDAIDAAIRETAEELGVAVGREAALGRLDDFVTLSRLIVTPVVLWSDEPLSLKPDPGEVASAWLAPIADLDHPKAPKFVPQSHGPPILRMYMRGRWINAPTAAWLYQFREVALHGREARVDGVGQPAWTAR